MRFIDYFRATKKNSAQTAKERLQVVIAHERAYHRSPTYLPRLKREILDVIRKYVPIAEEQVKVQVEREGDYEVLELNVTLPEQVENAS
jgi:cell division topological specificity factor